MKISVYRCILKYGTWPYYIAHCVKNWNILACACYNTINTSITYKQLSCSCSHLRFAALRPCAIASIFWSRAVFKYTTVYGNFHLSEKIALLLWFWLLYFLHMGWLSLKTSVGININTLHNNIGHPKECYQTVFSGARHVTDNWKPSGSRDYNILPIPYGTGRHLAKPAQSL